MALNGLCVILYVLRLVAAAIVSLGTSSTGHGARSSPKLLKGIASTHALALATAVVVYVTLVLFGAPLINCYSVWIAIQTRVSHHFCLAKDSYLGYDTPQSSTKIKTMDRSGETDYISTNWIDRGPVAERWCVSPGLGPSLAGIYLQDWRVQEPLVHYS
ncbi:hypothetical protein BJ085DRAFT_28468 [Dimargaris cristalligena]|uniref:Uncharacterized protein n=1 Tax=Dimargaris cristalligena TaxID=215637 RepID=A0A4P9ZQX7_9FUNG|nr:hypothetical protein BJ085DRAFT_28468 [Dimargaris cristalligena]|eukprot:RKP35906.1 hypothetical protein BJ085DRAFT_28468 [Dimargaris cristalligena]